MKLTSMKYERSLKLGHIAQEFLACWVPGEQSLPIWRLVLPNDGTLYKDRVFMLVGLVPSNTVHNPFNDFEVIC